MTSGTAAQPARWWLTVVAFGSGARVFALGSQFVVLLILSRVLAKDAFGDMMVAFALFRMISLGLGSGIGTLVLYHVGRAGGDAELNIRLHRSAALLGGLVALVATIGIVAGAEWVAGLFSKPGLALWLVHMSPFLLFSTLNTIAMNSLEGRARVTSAIMLNEVVPNAVRLVGLPLVWLLALPPQAAAHVMWIGLALPWLCELASLVMSRVSGIAAITMWDIRYAGFSALNSIGGLQLQGIDMLVAGWLFSSETVAGYAIASRLATLFPFFQQILLRNFSPRAGFLLKSGEIGDLNRELSRIRRVSMIAVGGLTGGILALSPFVMHLFGDYQGAVVMLAGLALPTLVRAFFPGNDVMLKMSGRAGISLMVSLLTVALLVGIPLLLGGRIGIGSIALGMLASAVLLNPVMSLLLLHYGIRIVALSDAPIVLVGCAGVVAAVVISQPMVTALVAASGALTMAGLALVYLRLDRTDEAKERDSGGAGKGSDDEQGRTIEKG